MLSRLGGGHLHIHADRQTGIAQCLMEAGPCLKLKREMKDARRLKVNKNIVKTHLQLVNIEDERTKVSDQAMDYNDVTSTLLMLLLECWQDA